MKILCPTKRVIDPYSRVSPLADGSGLNTSAVRFELNPFDEIAVEEAVRMKERDPNVTVTVVTIGSPEVEEQIRKALAMGADDGIIIHNTEPLDANVVAAELAAVAQGFDLVLMGKQSTDDDNGQVAQMLAARLGWPQATFASSLSISDRTATVKRETDAGEETLQLALPCVVTADLRLNTPRYVAIPGIIKARSKPLETRDRATDARAKTRVVRYDSPPPRPAGKKVANVDELLAGLKERGVL